MIHRLLIPDAPQGLEIFVARGSDPKRRGIAPEAMEALLETMLPDAKVTRRAHARPLVRGAGGNHISVSHAPGVTALAVAPVPVGTEVENVAPNFDFSDIDAEVFGPRDFAFLRRQDQTVQRAHFYRLWTLKEARLKRDGLSLADAPLPDILASHNGERPMLEGPAGPDMATRWLVQSGNRYCVAACWETIKKAA